MCKTYFYRQFKLNFNSIYFVDTCRILVRNYDSLSDQNVNTNIFLYLLCVVKKKIL